MSEQIIGLLGRALVPIAVLAVFALARRFMPSRIEPPSLNISPEDLAARFENTKKVYTLSMISLGLMFAWLTHALLVSLNHYYSVLQGGTGLRLLPQTAIWWFLPLFGPLTLSYELTLQLWSLAGGRGEAALYDISNSLQVGLDCRKVLRWAALVVALPIGLLTFLALPMHATVGQDEILDCGYGFSPCKGYRYADARRMTMVEGFRDRYGKLTHRAGIVIDFSDGRRWSSDVWSNFSESVDPELVKLLTAKTGLQLEYAATESDIRGASVR
jgi:hypothetical protein